jgi:hypothetical protein
MRGADLTQDSMFSHMTLSKFVPAEHPLWPIREILNEALREMDEIFAGMYADTGRDSIPPEQLLRGLILQSLYGLRDGSGNRELEKAIEDPQHVKKMEEAGARTARHAKAAKYTEWARSRPHK